MKKIFLLMISLLLVVLSCGNKSGATSEKNGDSGELTFMIWDRGQEPGMSAIAAEFEKQNPGAKVKVQVVGWDEYWTKLEAGATGGALPDLFWMHSAYFYDYASNDMLLEVDSKIDNGFEHFPKDLVELYQYKGKQYAVPKDFDTIGLFYNKELFDKAGVPYPKEGWTWADYLETAKKLTKDGVYGTAAPLNVQEGFWNTMYQNGGYVIKDGKSGYNDPASVEAIQWWLDLSLKEKVSPMQKDFDEMDPYTAFISGKVAMVQLGAWMVAPIEENAEFAKKVAVAPLPKGKQNATIYNGLGYAASAKTKNPELVKKFLAFVATEQANLIQAEKVAAIPAYKGTQQAWIDHNKDMNLHVLVDQLQYGVVWPTSPHGSKWRAWENELFAPVFSGKADLKATLDEYTKRMNQMISEEK